MDIRLKGVRKRGRDLWEVKPLGRDNPRLLFWRTGKHSITRDTITAAGINVKKYGSCTKQITFYRIRK